MVSLSHINHLCHTGFTWFDVSLVPPIDFEHLKERDPAKFIFIPEVIAQALTHFGTQ